LRRTLSRSKEVSKLDDGEQRLSGELSIRIGGDAGQGVESSGAGFCKALARTGLHVFATQDYRSRIRGGHNFYQIRAAGHPVHAKSDPPQLILALTPQTVDVHKGQLAPGAGVLYEESFGVDAEELAALGLSPMPAPLTEIAAAHGSRVMMNTAGMAALAAVVGFPLEFVESVIRDNFARKGEEVVAANLDVAAEAYRYARGLYGAFPHRLPEGDGRRRMVLHGNHALALGALAGGCRFVSAYPMTPATSIIEYLASVAAGCGVVTKHTEDEIAAICMAIGAGYAGSRAMTATSGGGFSLMAEALGLAGMAEIPLVVVNVQRGGPSTGLPTRTEQSDLLFTLHASQGEFPRVVLAAGTIEECFEAGWRAFNLAEKYQCPVIVLSDLYLASSLRTVEPEALDFASVPVERGALLSDEELDDLPDGYRRFALTGSGVSPRALPGHAAAVYPSSSEEHTEEGHITEEIHNRAQMVRKRMRKEETALAEDVRPPVYSGPERPVATLVCWGSTLGAVREAAELLNAAGRSAGVLHFRDLWPFPERAAEEALEAAGITIGVEQNYTGQLMKLIRMTTGRKLDGYVLSYDGRPYSPQEIVAAVERVLAGEAGVHVEPGELPLPPHTEVGVNV
jgi:2-oxoglutarate ferredoxin oxidoreductase subunit alpha